MTETSPVAAIAGITIIVFVGVVIYTIRTKIYASGNQTAITMLRISDTIIMIRFIGALLFMGIFLAIALSVGSASE